MRNIQVQAIGVAVESSNRLLHVRHWCKRSIFAIGFMASLMTCSVPAVAGAPDGCKGGRADMLRAFDKVYREFEGFLLKYYPPGGDPGGLRDFLSRPENYDIKISSKSDRYLIRFLPSSAWSGTIKGGGASYTIRKCTLLIEGAEPMM